MDGHDVIECTLLYQGKFLYSWFEVINVLQKKVTILVDENDNINQQRMNSQLYELIIRCVDENLKNREFSGYLYANYEMKKIKCWKKI
jgi:hypothetical protein